MAPKSGLAAQFGFSEETTYNIPVTPSLFSPLLNEKIMRPIDRLESKGIIAGARTLRSQQWAPGMQYAAGPIGLELYDRTISVLFKHMFGSVSTSGAGPYTHTYTPGDLTGKSLTIQMGRTDQSGTVQPFTYSGCKIGKWQLGLKAGEIATLGLDVVAKMETLFRSVTDGASTISSPAITSTNAAWSSDDVGKPFSNTNFPAGTTIASIGPAANQATASVNATATGAALTFNIGVPLAAVSYAAGISPVTFVGASLTIAGSNYKVNNVLLNGDNKYDEKRIFIDQNTISEPLETDQRPYTGTLDSELVDMTAYNRFVQGTEAAMVLTLVKGAMSCTITMNVRFDGDTPTVPGPSIIRQPLKFACIGPTTDASAITAVIINSEATP